MIIDGAARPPYSHDWMYFDHGAAQSMWPHADPRYLDLPALKSEIIQDYGDIRFQHLDAVGQSSKYIYPIFLRTWDYFFKMQNHGFAFVSDRVIQDVQQGRARIVILHPWEGTCGDPDWRILDQWVAAWKLPRDGVYFVHGNHADPGSQYRFVYRPVSMFQLSLTQYYTDLMEYQPSSTKDLFLSYNRGERRHRTLLICELFRRSLQDRGVFSYFNPHSTQERVRRYGREDLLQAAQLIDSLPRDSFQLEWDLSVHNPAFQITESHYRDTFLSLVTETLTEDVIVSMHGADAKHTPVFPTEKTWKPIAVGHPFIILAGCGHLAHLRSLGYQTFGNWWSEQYDEVENPDKKLSMIMEELDRLSRLNTVALRALRTEMEPVLRHNQKVLKKFRKKHGYQYWEPLYRIIQEIWQGF